MKKAITWICEDAETCGQTKEVCSHIFPHKYFGESCSGIRCMFTEKTPKCERCHN